MTSPLATRQRADAAHQASAVLQYRLAIVAGTALFIVLLMGAMVFNMSEPETFRGLR